MNKINPNSRLQGFQAAQEASADYRLEQKAQKRTNRTNQQRAKESGKSSSSELVRCAESIGIAINKWDENLNQSLQDWYQITEDLSELISEMNELTEEFDTMANVFWAYNTLVPAKGDNKVIYKNEEAIRFAEVMVYLGLGDEIIFSNVTIGGSPYYYLTPNQVLKYTKDYEKSHGGTQPAIEVKVQPHSDNNQESPSPEELQDMIKKQPQTQELIAEYPIVKAQLLDIETQISTVKNSQTKALFRVMTNYSFKHANIESLTNLLKNLSDNSRGMMNNIQ